jgi:tRNA dimethylallyltransferase
MTTEDVIRRFKESYNLLIVLGSTASGKTDLAVRLAMRIGGEIISADSRQVYIGMDLGTGKDISAYKQGGAVVPYHLIDIIEPTEEFNLFSYRKWFYSCFMEISSRGAVPILTGGTGLYLDAIVMGYGMAEVPVNQKLREELAGEEMSSLRRRFLKHCPEAHNTTDLLERKRLIRAIEIAEFGRTHPQNTEPPVKIDPFVIGIRCEREELRRRITARLRSRLEAGMIEEVKQLFAKGIGWKRIDSFGLEYRYIALHLQGKMDGETMFRQLNTRIHQFAKRQETWFRRMERNGVQIHWIEGADEDAAIRLIADARP